MTADMPSPLVPRLRFPEFEEKAAWSARPLTNVVRSISSGLSLTQTNGSNGFRVTRIETIADGTVDINRVGRVTTDQDISSYRLSIGDILVSNINSISHIGKSALIDRYYDLYYGMNLLRIEALSDVIYSRFLYYWLNTEIVRASIRSRANKAVNQASINQTELGNTVVLLPLLAEQQKIADCLGSLDDLIAAEGRTLEALRQHKQGLMQQLFPQPGETQPHLRFTEFRDAPDWEQAALGTLLDRPPEYGVNAAAVPFSEDLPAYIRITDIDDDGRFVPAPRVSVDIEPSDDQFLHPGDIVLARTGASVGKSYRYRVEDGRLVFAGFLIRVRPNLDRLVPEFLSAHLSTWSYWDWVRLTSARSGQPGINGSEYASMPLTMPTDAASLPEQRKIADCFAVLDEGIAAQRQRLRALRCHKNGLLQQLFPTPEAT